MTGEDVRQGFEAILPQEAIDRCCRACGGIERQRQRHLGMVVRAMVISAGTPGGAYQADIRRSSLACEVPPGARSAFSRGFDEPLARFMAALAAQALAYARGQQVDLSGLLGVVQDWYLVDSPTVTVRDARREEFPGAGAYAAITGPKVLSVGCGAPVHSHCSPAREHDRRHLEIEAAWRGGGLLADLAYASFARLRAGTTPGVRVVMRLQDHWQPQVDSMARGRVTPEGCPGTALAIRLAEDILRLDGRAIDAAVRVRSLKDALHLRLVGIHTPKGSCFFRTNLPPRSGPRQVADLYRVRWEVELSLKLDKSVHRLDQSDAARPWSVKTRLPASLIAFLLAARLAHTHQARLHPPQEGMSRTEAPLPPRRRAWPLAVSCQSMAQALDRKGATAKRRGQQLAALLMQSGKAPNGRRRPSVLDQLRGWKRQPVARKRANRDDLKAAA
jgi:putative transposase